MVNMDYLKRYQNGIFSAWDELVQQAPQFSNSPDYNEQAIALAEEIMVRVNSNLEHLRATLINSGASIGPKGVPSSANDFQFLTKEFGPLPLAIEIFYEKVGSINLTPKSDYSYGKVNLEKIDGVSLLALDPLQVFSATDLRWSIDEYKNGDKVDSFQLYLCPDFLHKQDISGGLPYSIELPPKTPEAIIDPVVQGERHSLTFINYLRYCFKWAGFPGLDVCEQKDEEININWRLGYKKVKGNWRSAYQRLLLELRKGLVEF